MRDLQLRPELKSLLKECDANKLGKINALFQMEMHNTLLGMGVADGDSEKEIIARCRGAAAFVSWVRSMQEQIAEYERGEVADAVDGHVL